MKAVADKQSGVMLIEALIGILIFAIGIIALMGLQAAAISNTTEAKYRSDAAYFANQIVGTMWIDKNNISSYTYSGGATSNASLADWLASVRAQLPSGDATLRVVTAAVDSYNVTVTVTWQKPGETAAHNFAVESRIDYQ